MIVNPSWPCFYALLERFFWDTLQLCYYGSLDGLLAFKTGALPDDPLCLAKRKKTHIDKD